MNRKEWQAILILALVVVLLAGCASAAPTPAPATIVAEATEAVEAAQSALALASTAWQAESFGGPDDSLPVIPDSYPSLYLMLERYSGYTGCNYFVGTYYVDGDTLKLETPAVTAGGCDVDGLAQQDGTYVSSLENVTNYELADDKLYLLTVEDQLLLTMIPLEPLPFEGTTWALKFISTEPAYWQAHLPDTVITQEFDSERLSGNAGCNDYSATYTRTEDRLTIGEISVTEKTCSEPEGVMDQESLYLSMLADVGAIAEFGRTIELLADDGMPMLLFHGQ